MASSAAPVTKAGAAIVGGGVDKLRAGLRAGLRVQPLTSKVSTSKLTIGFGICPKPFYTLNL
jgi:hypothetical protein